MSSTAEKTTASQRLVFDQGHAVGMEAHKRYPDGVLITASHHQHDLALKQTQDAISQGATAIFEATFEHEDVLVKIDILKRKSTEHPWDILEVKSSTEVKENHISDVAIQLWVARANLRDVASASIMTINTKCTFPDLENLFDEKDVTKEAETFLKGFSVRLENLRAAIQGPTPPKIDIGYHCNKPHACSFKNHCWATANVVPPSVFDIPGLRAEKKWKLYREGKTQLEKLNLFDFSEVQSRMIDCTLKKVRFINKTGISEELKNWAYPLTFLDFETINRAIPKYPEVRAYQQLPFQFSGHIRRKPGGELEHIMYLHEENSDPREALAASLVELIPEEGNIVAFSMATEGAILKGLAADFPAHEAKLLNFVERLVDPLPIFRDHVYDPAFCGGFSIKDIAPALLGEKSSYEGMDVADGQMAQLAYLELQAPDTGAERKSQLRKSLIEYCTKDTMEMVLLVDWLFQQTRPSQSQSEV